MSSTLQDKILFKFKSDTVTTVSRETVAGLAKVLGFNETQTIHYALARLRDAYRSGSRSGSDGEEHYPPLTAEQIIKIQEVARKPRGKLISSESLF